ncbi:hypothetical protein COT72_03370 [archaeon CG10_big_fil_rev_8_21_14_0_10_43_11]|nr:MAG: hypothetical protein COT72_03370 [archaeon CG10_big_fil_rev_8_21_14_0_10_43_11]
MNSKGQLKLILALIGFLLLLAPVVLLLSGFIFSQSSRSPTGEAIAVGINFQEAAGFSRIVNCSTPFIEVTREPTSLSDEGRGVLRVEICNYNERENLAPILSAFVSNFKQDKSFAYPGCTEQKTVPAGSFANYACELPLYSECVGDFHLHITTYKADVSSDVDEIVQVYPLLSQDQDLFCAKKPYNVRVTGINFNEDVNNPTITASIQNRFLVNDIAYAVSAINNACQNPDAQTGACVFCRETLAYVEENSNQDVSCRLVRQSNGIDYPYSILTQNGNISASIQFIRTDLSTKDTDGDGILDIHDPDLDGDSRPDQFITLAQAQQDDDADGIANILDEDIDGDGTLNGNDLETDSADENALDNMLSKETFYAFEFINVSMRRGSLMVTNHPTQYYATYSFDIQNNGDLEKPVDYTLYAQVIEHVTDPTPQEILLCDGSVSVPAGQTRTVLCSLQDVDGIGYTAISCDPEDGCTYSSDRVTARASISVTGQEANVYKSFERLESTQNLFVIPVYSELGRLSVDTPRRGDA